MISNTLPIIVIIFGLGIIISIILKKFSSLAAIDIETIPKEKQNLIKKKIIQERLQRRLTELFQNLKTRLNPPALKIKNSFNNLYNRALIWEKRHKKIKIYQEQQAQDEEDKHNNIETMLQEAEDLTRQNKLAEAEEVYIDIIKLDEECVAAYRGLSRIYLEKKESRQAEETFRYILKINSKDSDTLIDLGLLSKAEGNNEKALNYFKKALAIEPENPRFLDLLCETSIILGNKGLALETYRKLKEVNPENQKLEEIRERIKELE